MNSVDSVIGPTGSGKTSFIEALAKTPSGEGRVAHLNVDTASPTSHTIEHDGRRLDFIDTPGLDNTKLPDARIFTLVARWLDDHYQPNTEIGIIYLHRIINNRMRGSPHEHMETLRKRCNGVAVRQICLVTTMWNEVGENDTAEAEMRERYLKEEFEKQNVRALFKRLDNQPSSAWDAVGELIRDQPASNHRTLDSTIFLVIGPTGSGKTSFIEALDETPGYRGTADLNTDTASPTSYTIERDGRCLDFIDTPGLDNIKLQDAEIFMLVARWLDDHYQPNTEVRIIYLHRITNNRIRGSPHEHIEMLRKRCNGVAVRQICLVTTMWNEVGENDTAEAEMRERYLKEEFEKRNVRALFKRLDNQPSSAWDIVSELIGVEARRLQEELEDRARRSNEPETGRASYNQLQVLLSKRREALQDLLAQAATEEDIQDLQQDLDQLDARIRETLEEVRERNASIIRRVLQWLAERFGTTASVPSSSSTASHPETNFSQYY